VMLRSGVTSGLLEAAECWKIPAVW
jgi:hypothetical protein